MKKLVRKLFVGGNWKCNNTMEDTRNLVSGVLNNLHFDTNKVDVIVSPVFLHIPYVQTNVNKSVQVSSQNLSLTPFGAFTGEIAAKHLTDLGIDWTILGHSERRQFYGENNEVSIFFNIVYI